MKISTINAMLTANATQFLVGCKQATQAATQLGSSVASVAGGMAAYEIGKEALSKVYDGTIGLVHSQMEAIDSTAKLSDTLGISTKALSQLQYAASYSGTTNEDLASGLIRLNKALGGTADDGEDVSNAFSKIGLNNRELLAMAPEVRFAKVADALKGVGNAAERNADASAIFGKGFAPLMPLLNEGSEGLKKFADEADAMGFSFDRTDAAKVEQANDALQKISNIVTAIGTQIAIDLAPYITAAADAFSGLALSGGNMGDIVLSAVEGVVTAITYAAGTIDVFQRSMVNHEGNRPSVAAGILYALDGIGSAIASVANLIPGVNISFEGLGAMADSFASDAKQAFSDAGDSIASVANGDRQQAVSNFFQTVRDGAQKAAEATADSHKAIDGVGKAAAENAGKVADQIEKLKQTVATFGQTDSQKLAADLKSKGATPEQIAQATAAQDQLDALKAQQKAHEDAASEAKKYYDETRTGSEKYAAEVERINKLVSDGALDADTAARAKKKAQDDLDKATADQTGDKSKDDKGPDGPKLLQAGSAEAATFVSNIQRDQRGGDSQKTLVSQGKQGNKYLEQLVKNTANGTGGSTALTVVTFA